MFINIMLMNIIMLVIKREKLIEKIKDSFPRVIIYGRRKTGKTFLVKNFIQYDFYFFVGRDKRIIKNGNDILNYKEFFELFKELVKLNKTIVIDEFHRLPSEFFDFLHFLGNEKSNLILVSSTTWLTKELVSKNSPLLALFNNVLVSLIDEWEMLSSLSKNIKKKEELVTASIFLREPILIPFYKNDILSTVINYLYNNRFSINSLILEIFEEESKELSVIYEAILKLIAEGKQSSGELANELYSLGLLKKNNPGLIQRYLETLKEIGIIKKIKFYGKKRYFYEHVSPLIDLHYYLESKYYYTENDINEKFIQRTVSEKIPKYAEIFFRELLAKKEGLIFQKIIEPEIDISLFEFNKLKVVGEVKWKNSIKSQDIYKTIEKLENFDCQKMLIVKDKSKLKESYKEILKESGVKVKDITDFLN